MGVGEAPSEGAGSPAEINLKDTTYSPFVTRYFATIAEWDALPEERQRAFLTRVGFDVEEDAAFGRAAERFRGDQQATIIDWNRRKGR